MSRCGEQASTERIELGLTIHLALYQLQFGVLSFCLSIRPLLGKGGLHRQRSLRMPVVKEASRLGFASEIQLSRPALLRCWIMRWNWSTTDENRVS